ncbi:MAG TPA: substrate-binding domain-containing protein [candidate division Zixibacteria bacterium]|nr:substrate-binding domain-containing protein [candidate division Zixibacteria bacterium]
MLRSVACWVLVAFAPALAAGQSRIVVGGAQSLTPLAERFSEQFRASRAGVTVEIRKANSNYALKAVRSGDLHVGLLARNPSDAERAQLHIEALGRDPVLLLTYPANTVLDISLARLRRIYLGQITDWSQIGGENQGIVPLTREPDSALHKVFVEILFGKGFRGTEKAFVLRATKEKVLRTVKRVQGSIGYGIVRPEEAAAERVKVLAVDGKFPSPANVENGTYPFTRRQLAVSRRDPDRLVLEWMRGFAKFATASRNGRED